MKMTSCQATSSTLRRTSRHWTPPHPRLAQARLSRSRKLFSSLLPTVLPQHQRGHRSTSSLPTSRLRRRTALHKTFTCDSIETHPRRRGACGSNPFLSRTVLDAEDDTAVTPVVGSPNPSRRFRLKGVLRVEANTVPTPVPNIGLEMLSKRATPARVHDSERSILWKMLKLLRPNQSSRSLTSASPTPQDKPVNHR